MPKRAKVYHRAEEPPRMRITQRDLRILQAVESFRFISGEQIERLIFLKGGEKRSTRCAIRLRKLFDSGLLGRVRWPFQAITLPMVYYLDQGGADLLALKLGVERDAIRSLTRAERRPAISRSLLFLAHALAVNDFRIEVALACEERGFELVKWLNEYELGRDYVQVEHQGRSRQQAVQPDGYFVIRAGERQAHFFLEMDMETTPSKRWAPKVLGLYEYRSRGHYAERFETKSLRVLCVTPSDSRERLLVKWTREVVPAGWQPLFWFTTQEQVEAGGVLTEPIWTVAGEGGRRAVLGGRSEG